MIRLDTLPEVVAFLKDYATAQHHAETLAAMTAAERAEAFRDCPPAAPWADHDVDEFAAQCGERPAPKTRTRRRK